MTVLDAALAGRLARIALSHVSREYPNRLDHVLTGPDDVRPPRALHPVFFGSFDWHSCVHSHWLLATVHRLFPELPESAAIRNLFDGSFTAGRIAGETDYLARPSARGFERPYGWAWLLMLQCELLRAGPWAPAMQPLADVFVRRFHDWLPRATYPVRTGMHGNTAFALRLAFEYADEKQDFTFAELLRQAALRWYAFAHSHHSREPDGEDFLSPTLVQAQCMSRVLPRQDFAVWFEEYLPDLHQGEPRWLFAPAHVSDRSDGRIVHLDGLNLSRAWSWYELAGFLDPANPVRALATDAANLHLDIALPAISGDYMGEHWLATYACLALLAQRQPGA